MTPGRFVKRGLIGVGVMIVVFAGLAFADYQILWLGNCESSDHYRISRLRGRVVGRSLGILQYRWLRRRFKAVGTELTVTKAADYYYQGNLIKNEALVGEQTVGGTGTFDFGRLPPGEYSMLVTLPGEDSVGFAFSIDPEAQQSEVLVDASPGYYCRCCGWDFEPH